MLGIVLLYVGIVLINNGISRLYNIDEKSVIIGTQLYLAYALEALSKT